MLGDTAEKTEPTAVLGADCKQDNEEPMPAGDKNECKAGMSNQKKAGPVSMAMPKFFVAGRQDMIVPVALNIPLGVAPSELPPGPSDSRIPCQESEPNSWLQAKANR